MKGFTPTAERHDSTCVTDNDWIAFLSQQPEIDVVNFWQRI